MAKKSSEPDATESTTFSKLVVDLLRMEDPTIRKRGFPHELREILKDNTPQEMVFRKGRRQTLQFIPDAFRVDSEEQEITLYEVEDSNFLTIRKLSIIVNLWWVLDDMGWNLRLVVVDRYGVNRKELDLHCWSDLLDQFCSKRAND